MSREKCLLHASALRLPRATSLFLLWSSVARTPATHNQLELIDSFPAIDRDGALSRRRIVASAECAHEPLQCSLRTHFHARMSCTRPTL